MAINVITSAIEITWWHYDVVNMDTMYEIVFHYFRIYLGISFIGYDIYIKTSFLYNFKILKLFDRQNTWNFKINIKEVHKSF